MLLKTTKGMYQLVYNYHEAFNLEDFTSKYIEEFMDSYPFIVGDISSNILRLKGFSDKPESSAYYKNINNYLEVSCAFGCPFYILKRVTSEENYEKLSSKEKEVITDPLFVIPSIQKVNYDKDSLVLENSRKAKPRIILDMNKILAVPRDKPFPDVVEFINQDKTQTSKEKKAKPVTENVTSYVSASPDFDPSKKNKFNKSKNQKQNNKDVNQTKPNQGKPNTEKKNNFNNKPKGKKSFKANSEIRKEQNNG